MMKKLIILLSIIICFGQSVFCAENTTLSAGISMNAKVPQQLMGTWRVVSKLVDTNSPENFKEVGVVIWNLSRSGDVISLCNPFTGAQASVNVEYVEDNTVKFSKEGNYEDKKLIDTVEITLEGNSFSGKNYLIFRAESDANNLNKPAKSATYVVVGRKISGSGVLE